MNIARQWHYFRPFRLLILWLGTLFPAIAFPTNNTSQYISQSWRTEDGLPNDSVNAIAQTRDGYLWLATEFGFRWRQERPLAVAAGPASALQPDSSPARRARWDSLDWLL